MKLILQENLEETVMKLFPKACKTGDSYVFKGLGKQIVIQKDGSWKDSESGEAGDIMTLHTKAINDSGVEAFDFLCSMFYLSDNDELYIKPTVTAEDKVNIQLAKEIWNEGVQYALNNPIIVNRLDESCHWPDQTAHKLVKNGFLSILKVKNEEARSYAFPIYNPIYENETIKTEFMGFSIGNTCSKGAQPIPLVIGKNNLQESGDIWVFENSWDMIILGSSVKSIDPKILLESKTSLIALHGSSNWDCLPRYFDDYIHPHSQFNLCLGANEENIQFHQELITFLQSKGHKINVYAVDEARSLTDFMHKNFPL